MNKKSIVIIYSAAIDNGKQGGTAWFDLWLILQNDRPMRPVCLLSPVEFLSYYRVQNH